MQFPTKLFSLYNKWDIILIPDCRYPIEVEEMKKHFDTILIRIERPNFDNGLSYEQQNHISETSLDNYKYDVKIFNDGTLEDFRVKLETYIKTLEGRY